MPAWTQSTITPEEQYKELIRVDQDIQPLGEHPFGEDIGLYNGSLSFHVTDVSASGNGPLLQLTRSFKLQSAYGLQTQAAEQVFADWSLDLPRIKTFVVENGFVMDVSVGHDVKFSGWRVGANSPLRCANFATPPWSIETGLHTSPTPSSFGLGVWWTGYHLIIPGQGDQDLLKNTDSATQGTYPAVTKNHWRLSCIDETQTANGQPGDGFVAHAPDGTTYYFNELVYRLAPSVPGSMSLVSVSADPHVPKRFIDELENPKALLARVVGWLTGAGVARAEESGKPGLDRHVAYLLVTKIEDRFGNSLTYHYDANDRLTSIVASDGRKLSIHYDATSGWIASVTLQPASSSPRTWTYGYTTVQVAAKSGPVPSLDTVTLPDGRQWSYQFAGLDGLPSLGTVPGTGSCNYVWSQPDAGTLPGYAATITHPSGLTGTFTVKVLEHARSDVPHQCGGLDAYHTPDTVGTWAVTPRAWRDYTLTRYTQSGAGLSSSRTWAYTYSDPHPSWNDCSGSCPTTEWTKVKRPDGSVVKRTFSNKYDITESHLLRTDFYASASAGTPLRSVVNTYAAPTMASLPASAGGLLTPRVNVDQATKYSPVSKRAVQQNGDTYTWQVEAFDAYAHVTKDKRFNSIAGQQASEVQTTYRNDTTHWVLGLPTQIKNLTTDEVEDAYTYNTTTDLLTSRAHFGQTVMHYTWNSAGQLASFTDANGHKTTLSSYKRGIPQTIGYPDGTTQHLTVDGFGQISSITNQAGDKTQYAYDSVGRLTKITYPSGWNPKTFAYAYATGAERGLGAGHWRRTVSQGSARHVTYYDALLHPVLTDTYITGVGGSHISARTAYNWKGLTTFASWPVAGSPSLSAITAGTTTTYDALGRVTAVSQPSELGTLTTTTTYLSGARKKVTDPAGHATTTSYQVFDTPSYKAVTKVQAPEGIVQTITRNLHGAPTAITQSGPDDQGGTVSVTKYLYYNAQHRLCRTEEPETGSTLLGYDDAGNLAWSAEGRTISGSGCGSAPATSSRTNRTYDAMNRLTAVSYPDGQGDTITTYTALGQVASTQAMATNGSAQWHYTYDTLGHLTNETLGADGYNWPIHYTYDVNGTLSQITYPDGKAIAYAPDALGRPSQAGTYATGVGYFPDGALKQFTYMGSKADYLADRFDPANRPLLKNLTVGSGSTLVYSEDFVYDKDANITHTTDLTLNGERSKTLTYDALNRLTQAKAPALWGTASYGYDALNNLRHLTSDGLARTYHYDTANRLTSIQNGTTILDTFAYDPSGNITQKDSQGRVFSVAHRLLQVPGTASYVYDAAGRRVKATDASGHAVYSVYNRAGQLMVQWNKATATTTDYVYLGKQLVAEVATSPLPPASAPSLSAPATDSDGNYTVSWGSVGTATSYMLQEQTGGSWSTIHTGNGTSQAITGKGNGSYGYRVKACNPGGCSSWSTTRTVTVTHSPGSAPSLSVPVGNHTGSYTVSWGAVGTATSYTLQERTGTGSWATTYSGSNRSRAISGKGNGSYGYRVQACNVGGCGNWSAIGTVTVLLPPPAPSSLSVPTADNDGSYTVSWGAASTATSYTLQARTNGGSWVTAYSGSGRSKAESGKGNGSYGYRVQACNAGGCGAWSGVKTVVVTHPPASAPSLSVPATDSNGSYTVSWGAVSTATSYTLQERLGSGSWGTTYSGAIRSKALSGKTDGTYGYRVRACTVGGCGPWSGTKTVKVARPPSSAPSLSVPSTNHDGSYTVSWGSVSRATSYTLQERKGSGSWSTIYTGSSRSKARSGRTDGSYGYRVKACSAGGCGPWSATHAVSVAIVPPAPANVHIHQHGTYKVIYVDLVWDAVSGASHYDVKANGSSTVIDVGTATSYRLGSYRTGDVVPIDTGQVRSCNANGCSAWAGSGL